MWVELDLSDASSIMELRNSVLNSLHHSDEYVREDDEDKFVKGHLGEFGESFGYFENGLLVAYCALTTDIESSGEVREFEMCNPRPDDMILAAGMVRPGFRGRGLQREAIKIRLERASQRGVSEVFAQVSSRNTNSLQNLFAEGFQCSKVTTYPDSRSRLILAREMNIAVSRTIIEDVSLVPMEDFARINSEIESGRRGFKIIRALANDFMVVGV